MKNNMKQLIFLFALLWCGIAAQCNNRTSRTSETYWCWKRWRPGGCTRTVTKTYYDCSYFAHESSCVAANWGPLTWVPGFLEYHSACYTDPSSRDQYTISWTDGCLGWFSDFCHGGGSKTFDSRPSTSRGCMSALLDCPGRRFLRGDDTEEEVEE